MQEVIRSSSNPLVKRARAVGAGRERGFVLLEGQRLVEESIVAGWALEAVFVSEKAEQVALEIESALPGARGPETVVRRVEADLVGRMSSMKAPPAVLAVAREPVARPLSAFEPHAAGLLVIAAGVQDPGNLGAIARAAEAAGAGGLVVAGDGARPFGAKALRGSMGSLLRIPVAVESDASACARTLTEAGWRQALGRARGGTPYAEFDWRGPLALWFAAESGELPADVAEEARAFEGITIPMAGAVESLNVATAAAILCFAAGRVSKAAEGEPR